MIILMTAESGTIYLSVGKEVQHRERLLFCSVLTTYNPIFPFRNRCAASGCLSFPEASWEKSRQIFHHPHRINTQAVRLHVKNTLMKEFMSSIERDMIRLCVYIATLVCICM